MKRYQFSLSISANDYLKYYEGTVTKVVVRTTCGVMIKFPARLLQSVITANGIHGHFELTCDDNLENSRIRKLA